MERILLCLDDLDDLFYALAFAGERVRVAFRALFRVLGTLFVGLLAVLAALHEATLGAACLALYAVLWLYRSATSPPRRKVANPG